MAQALLLSLRVIWSGSGEKEIFPCGQDDSAVVDILSAAAQIVILTERSDEGSFAYARMTVLR